jgi:predicted ABC-type transport system involved in lysophospholipase L1 biosynthesis ATPase subunit
VLTPAALSIDGDDLSQLSDAELTNTRRRKTGIVFQRFNLLPMLDARSNILIAQDIAGRSRNSDPAYFQKITEMLGLTNRLYHRPSERLVVSSNALRLLALSLASGDRAGRRTHRQLGFAQFPCCADNAAANQPGTRSNSVDDYS